MRRSRRGRKLLAACSTILGDTNGDCTFDVEDVQSLQYYIGGALNESSLSAQQIAAMDPDLDGDSDGVDIAYLMKVVANKYRFLANFSSVADPFGLYAEVWTSASAAAEAASTVVAFEIGTSLNQGLRLELVAGTNQTDTDDGVYVVAEVADASNQPGKERPLSVEKFPNGCSCVCDCCGCWRCPSCCSYFPNK